MGKLRIAMLHLSPTAADLGRNRGQLENAVETAADLGADWVLTPELCLSGYVFEGCISPPHGRPFRTRHRKPGRPAPARRACRSSSAIEAGRTTRCASTLRRASSSAQDSASWPNPVLA